MPTAFAVDGALDLQAQRELAAAVVGWGADGITVLGVMGEASTLSFSERAAVIEAVTAGAPGTPLAVGCSGASVHSVVANVQQARERGASLAMVSAPTLLRDVDALPGFMASVATRGGLPLIVQDEPAATGVSISVSILKQCLDASGAEVLKLEDPPTPNKITRLLAVAPGTSIFGGLGGAAAYFELRRGAVGTMTGFSYPEILKELRQRLAEGRSGCGLRAVRALPSPHRLRGRADRRPWHSKGAAPPARGAAAPDHARGQPAQFRNPRRAGRGPGRGRPEAHLRCAERGVRPIHPTGVTCVRIR